GPLIPRDTPQPRQTPPPVAVEPEPMAGWDPKPEGDPAATEGCPVSPERDPPAEGDPKTMKRDPMSPKRDFAVPLDPKVRKQDPKTSKRDPTFPKWDPEVSKRDPTSPPRDPAVEGDPLFPGGLEAQRWRPETGPLGRPRRPPARTRLRNRRYAALRQLIQGGEYFSEEEMRAREPLLYQHYIGQYRGAEPLPGEPPGHP
ncbi:CCD97 protein, partial [Scopus umbretta]|nr:CCD97 protein [Scopus umbretta]